MYFEIMTEDLSTEKLLEHIMTQFHKKSSGTTWRCTSFHGIGGFDKDKSVKDSKTGKILNDLSIYIKAFQKCYGVMGTEYALIIIVDNDDRDTEAFRSQLEEVAENAGLKLNHVFAIAVEEMEAWLLGDMQAIVKAYPKAKKQVITKYVQDSICGTWEKLAEAVYPGGLRKMRKDCITYQQIGMKKCEWADNIGQYMELDTNESPSFNYMVSEIDSMISDN